MRLAALSDCAVASAAGGGRPAARATSARASHAISDAGAASLAVGGDDAGELLSAAKAFIGDRGNELLQDCVQIHGGIGVTFEHDLHLFLRRVMVNSMVHGTSREHLRRVADLAEQREAAA